MTSTSKVASEVIALPHGKVRYGSYGSGFPMLLISGFGWGSWTYERVIEPLAEHYHVYAPEAPGFHGSDRPNDWYRMQDFSEGIMAFMDALGIQQAHVVGQHSGALMIFDLAARHPERVKKLVLNGCPGWTREEGRRYHEDDWLLRQFTEQGLMPQRTLERVKKVITNADQRVVDLWDKGHTDKSWLLICHVALTEYDVPSYVAQVQAPTLLLYGAKETGHLLAGKETLLSGIRDVRAETIANAAILPPYEQPELFSKSVLDFIGT